MKRPCRAFSARVTLDNCPGALPQAVTFRAAGAFKPMRATIHGRF
jgi:hypothetical protein